MLSGHQEQFLKLQSVREIEMKGKARTHTNKHTGHTEGRVFLTSTFLTDTFMTRFEINTHYNMDCVWLLYLEHLRYSSHGGSRKGALTVNQKVKPIIASLITAIKPLSLLTYHKKHFP